MPRGLLLWFCVMACTLAVSGCRSRLPARHPVSGKVLVNGVPAARARVFLVPLDSSPLRPSAEVRVDGSFQMSGQDGAAAGEYAVTIVWPTYETNGGEEIQTGDRLEGRYEDARNPVVKITIRAGKNELPAFELQSP